MEIEIFTELTYDLDLATLGDLEKFHSLWYVLSTWKVIKISRKTFCGNLKVEKGLQ